MNELVLQIAGKLLTKHRTVATAESCTGGYIAHLITAVAGSSEWFRGGVISYSNEMKMNVLGVQPQTLEKFGAVSEETVREMVSGILKVANTDYGIAVSGIAGPGGGSSEKPVGTVWIAVADKEQLIARKFQFGTDRLENITASANSALELLLREFL